MEKSFLTRIFDSIQVFILRFLDMSMVGQYAKDAIVHLLKEKGIEVLPDDPMRDTNAVVEINSVYLKVKNLQEKYIYEFEKFIGIFR